MEAVFLKVLNMSIAAGWLILAVAVLRLCLRKAPKWLTCLLWGLVGVRLACPFSFESVLSLIPSGETVPPQIVTDAAPAIDSGIYAVDRVVNTVISPSFYPQPEYSVTPLQVLTFVAAAVWLVGIAVMLLYAVVSTLRLRRRVREAAFLRENIWACDAIGTPFILGLFRPRILLPSTLSAADEEYVLAHERAHLQRRDHWWKPLGYLLLAVHWFNPLVWLAYALLCRDIELACDERVVRALDTDRVKAYSTALLECSMPRRTLSACPLAFGEVGVKHRIKAVLHYRKPAFWIVLVAVATCAVTAVCFLTDPAATKLKNIEDHSYETHIEETVSVLASSDGQRFHRLEAVSDDLLQELAEIPIARNYLSLSRSSDRDKSHTLVLQDEKDAEKTISSALKGLRIHFSVEFASVWVNDGVKPTLSYRVNDPEKARDIYNRIVGDTVFTPTDSNAPDENVNESFCATVLELREGTILVEPLAGEWIIGKVSVSTNLISTHPLPELKVGDTVRVVFNGEVMETYPAQVSKVFAIYKLETAPTRTVATEAFSVTFSSFYVEKGRIDVTGDGDEQSIGIYEPSSYEEYGGHVASLCLFPKDVDLFESGPPSYTLYGTMRSPEGEEYHLIATYPTDVQYSPQAEGTYAVLRKRLDTVMETLTPAEGWRFTPATATTPTIGPSGTPPATVTGTTTAPTTTTALRKEVESITVMDADKLSPDVMVKFYEDEKNIYYFGCGRTRLVAFKDGSVCPVPEALENGYITITDLDRFGIAYWPESKTEN